VNLPPPKATREAWRGLNGPVARRQGSPKFKQRNTRQVFCKPPRKGIQSF
uniref:3',5'-cyclic-GMP phosphodiesterase n=2 Tax=Canis lupus familiaris TaxID=9615 RepID=A0A8C0PUS1_CANLF